MRRISAAWSAFRNPRRVEVRGDTIHIYGQSLTQAEAKAIRAAAMNCYTATIEISGADIERVLRHHRRRRGGA